MPTRPGAGQGPLAPALSASRHRLTLTPARRCDALALESAIRTQHEQPMASLLEQALFLFEDIVVMLLIEQRGVSMAEMQRRHTNREGVMGEFA